MPKISNDGRDTKAAKSKKTDPPAKQVNRKTMLHDGKTPKINRKPKINHVVTLEGCQLLQKNERMVSTGKVMGEIKINYNVREQPNDAGKKLSDLLSAGGVLMVGLSTKQMELGIDKPPDDKKNEAK